MLLGVKLLSPRKFYRERSTKCHSTITDQAPKDRKARFIRQASYLAPLDLRAAASTKNG